MQHLHLDVQTAGTSTTASTTTDHHPTGPTGRPPHHHRACHVSHGAAKAQVDAEGSAASEHTQTTGHSSEHRILHTQRTSMLCKVVQGSMRPHPREIGGRLGREARPRTSQPPFACQ